MESRYIDRQHKWLETQFEIKCKELKKALDDPKGCLGFLNLVRDVEFLYMEVEIYRSAIKDVNDELKKNQV